MRYRPFTPNKRFKNFAPADFHPLCCVSELLDKPVSPTHALSEIGPFFRNLGAQRSSSVKIGVARHGPQALLLVFSVLARSIFATPQDGVLTGDRKPVVDGISHVLLDARNASIFHSCVHASQNLRAKLSSSEMGGARMHFA
jgi:hypothetical protein